MRRRPGQLLDLEARILGALVDAGASGAGTHGFALAKELADRQGSHRLTSHGTLYKALGRLEAAGAVTSHWEESAAASRDGRPRRRLYRVTGAGRAALRDHLDAAAGAGVTPLGCMFPDADLPLTVFVADDPDRAWAELGEYLLVDAVGYGRWNAHRTGTASVSQATTVAELRAEEGPYRIITPDAASELLARGFPLALQPLVGGIPPEIAWRYLEQAAAVGPPT